ncbi:MAG TPA: hypothetical protein DDW21_05365, partial [Verrucomicrobiales bacterium]|nr:hypothetical protein [Verrucomicrobiales bacterium]
IFSIFTKSVVLIFRLLSLPRLATDVSAQHIDVIIQKAERFFLMNFTAGSMYEFLIPPMSWVDNHALLIPHDVS